MSRPRVAWLAACSSVARRCSPLGSRIAGGHGQSGHAPQRRVGRCASLRAAVRARGRRRGRTGAPEVNLDGESAISREREDHGDRVLEMSHEKQDIKRDLREQQLKNEDASGARAREGARAKVHGHRRNGSAPVVSARPDSAGVVGRVTVCWSQGCSPDVSATARAVGGVHRCISRSASSVVGRVIRRRAEVNLQTMRSLVGGRLGPRTHQKNGQPRRRRETPC